ncbi:MAG: FAD-dependent oxidoreductase [Acidobacteria bacterium]|nr:FAD-dependent oxidoreductase [Acidobacteriota bacterium]MBI3656199.1 FAD-dependent oxidoreductase [Acidobacteriota bacterium]
MNYSISNHTGHLAFVIGAGPAGMSVIENLSKAGHYVVVLNRDIKFGGLAEYGIFPSKHKMKEGLRKRYRELIARENVEYFGNVPIGNDKVLSFDELRRLQPSVVIFAAGAQGTKSLSVPGESADGVFHAKELVYHYNGLPPFSERTYKVGDHVAVVGIGNVMVDIAHWLIRYRNVRQVTAIARRGPAERKYDEKEIRHVCANIDRAAVLAEFDRIRQMLINGGQNPVAILDQVLGEFTKCEPASSQSRMSFRFLSSPERVLTDAAGRVRALTLQDTRLERQGDNVIARPLGTTYEFPCDSVVFAVGDRVDDRLGLPIKDGIIPTGAGAGREGAPSFQVFDPQSGTALEGVFVTGWCRNASEGLVGIAKRDGDLCSEAVSKYMVARSPIGISQVRERVEKLRALISARQAEAVTKQDIKILESVEREMAQQRGLEEFKFHTNREMLAAIENYQART